MKRALSAVLALLVLLVTPAACGQPEASAGAIPQKQSQAAPDVQHGKQQLTLQAIFSGPAASESPRFVQWSPDGKRLSFVRANAADHREELYSIDPASGQGTVMIAADRLAPMLHTASRLSERERENRARYGVSAYHWAPDSQHLLFDAEGQLWLYDVRRGRSGKLTDSAEMTSDPKFSPDSRYISFLRGHDLFVRPLDGGNETRLTKSGNEYVLNGEVDWVYQEELDVRSNYSWSPDGQHIVYLQMDETSVPSYPIVNWLPVNAGIEFEKYPKPGDANPAVRLAVVDLEGHSEWLNFTSDDDIYIPRFGWLNARTVWALVLNRAQNKEELYFIDAKTGRSRLALTETDAAYIELHDAPRFLEAGNQFLWTSWRDGHTHLYLYRYDSANPVAHAAKLVRQITRGDWEVLEVNGLDENSGVVYFTANKDDARQANLFVVNLDGSALRRLTPERGFHQAKLPKAGKYFVDVSSSLTTPPRMQVCGVEAAASPDIPSAHPVECREIWRSAVADNYNLLRPEFVDFKTADGTPLHGVILLPPSAPNDGNGKVPLIVNVYGGPREQMVRDSWFTATPFDQVLAQRGFAILKVDNRGTSNRGRQFAVATRSRLGEIELQDQLAALEQVLARYPRLDRNRLGCWGWSFGGTLAAYSLLHSTLFQAAVAVAPVTDWYEYDSIYTERYMGLPVENRRGYQASSLLQAAPGLSGHLLLAHGSSDDNVHVQNSMQFANALIAAGKQFDMQIYPGKTHFIGGVPARMHLYQMIEDCFERWLKPH